MANTVIIGSGIIGVSTAYYLSQHQPASTIHLVEASPELFASASGYAGGFLAKDWFGPGVASLGALSFDQHRKLAEKYDGAAKWGYSRSTSLSYTSAPSGKSQKQGDDWLRQGTRSSGDAATVTVDGNLDDKAPGWLRRVVGDRVKLIGDDDTAAQV